MFTKTFSKLQIHGQNKEIIKNKRFYFHFLLVAKILSLNFRIVVQGCKLMFNCLNIQ